MKIKYTITIPKPGVWCWKEEGSFSIPFLITKENANNHLYEEHLHIWEGLDKNGIKCDSFKRKIKRVMTKIERETLNLKNA